MSKLWNIPRPNFKVEPVYLSEEHAKQVERFTGYPYEPEEDAMIKAYVAYKRWEQKELISRGFPVRQPPRDKGKPRGG